MNHSQIAIPSYAHGKASLHCPNCGDSKNDSYLHLEDFDKVGESVSLIYSCELCGQMAVLQLVQAKGHTLAYWQEPGKPKPIRLTGQGLLDQIKKLGDVPKSKLVEACGYIIPAEGDKKQRLDYTSFYEALLWAKGIDPRTGVEKGKK
jgi:hypothetical protein|tara:strand:- start:43 stop:486 length:444 start_codon:yes stop_codon:yes gene_type:complete